MKKKKPARADTPALALLYNFDRMEHKKFIDLHVDLVSHVRDGDASQTNMEAVRKNNRLFFASVFIDPKRASVPAKIHECIKTDIAWYRGLEKSAFVTISTKTDLVDMQASQKTGFILHVEGADALTPQTENYLEEWANLGLRSLGLVWNADNALATSAASFKERIGLSDFGKQIVQKLNNLHVIIDLAHINERGFYDVLEISTVPPIVTHGNSYVLAPHPRNFTDEQLVALRDAGGIVGVFFSGKYINPSGSPTIDDVVRHILHIVEVAGVDTVAIGSDFGGITSGLVSGLEHVDRMNDLARKLAEVGVSNGDRERIFYGNVSRYLERHFQNHA
ncbi:MAG: hypothetical protein A3J55_03890 [Candidatus Ryanbacteria bacterium RIFCSPHIGHO2_02_FULL_45_17b]|uniref:Peptidase n=1 Tax=Candidatus Ryanbacteria bacterium RIFCSPHIGHO2_01_FULL_45_22 TaxID=1802114 RepID=A0A1G2FXG7_9BACT|nr:MAG: hypothetical protein A2719_02030 [Candidatus Ryanbacteria bacterium RIFCSPHIGHO2_01_FULL_45_22]OGZ46422.1 MAG: hypothetical protein A3J55_03890 [Candidatus Ryanbacteria bacterium RIFCSPHIGHO2_02_FULL_45_17b]